MKRTKKRLLSILSAVALTLCSLPQEGLLTLLPPMTAHAEESYTEVTDEGGIRYAVYVDHAEVIGAADVIGTSSSHGQAIIQSEINGRPVTVIGKLAFALRRDLYSVVIPESVEIIKEKAFADSRLQQLHNMSNVKVIEANAFFSVNIKSIELPDSLTELGDLAFAKCSLLSSLSIGSGLRTIGNNPFAGDKYFGVDPITGEPLGTGLVCSEENPYFKMKDGALWSADGKRLVCSNQLWSNTEYEIPVGTVDISYAFYESDIETVTVPASVTKMDYAFSKCKRLQNITLCEGLKSISQHTFEGCEKLESLKLPDSLTELGEYALANATGLKSVTLGKNLESIGRYAFQFCRELKSLTIPDTVIKINDFAFIDCNGLQCISFGSGVRSIGNGVFIRDNFLDTIRVSSKNPYFKEKDGGLWTIDETRLVSASPQWTEYEIPDGVTDIRGAFRWLDQMIGITVPESVTDAEAAFQGCTGLTALTIPASVTTIGTYAFAATRMKEVEIPANIETLGNNAFSGCPNLEKITVSANEICAFAFEDNPKLTTVTLTDSVKKIGGGVFRNDVLLEAVEIPATVEFLGDKPFEGAVKMNTEGRLIVRTTESIFDGLLSEDFGGTVYGYPESGAQSYCADFGYRFVPICTVSYAANGGKGEMSGKVVLGEITLPECGFTAPTGKNFAGWTAGDDGIIYPAGKTLSLTGDTVITATWQTVTVTVTLDANGGEGTAVRSSVISGSLFTFPNCTFTAPEGKQFAGWQVGEKIYQVGDSLKVTKDTKATAVWEKTKPAFLVGDVDGDGKVDTKDAMILSRYVGGWEGIVLDMNAADLDRDGNVDVRDAMILSRYVAAWEGYDKYIIEIE